MKRDNIFSTRKWVAKINSLLLLLPKFFLRPFYYKTPDLQGLLVVHPPPSTMLFLSMAEKQKPC